MGIYKSGVSLFADTVCNFDPDKKDIVFGIKNDLVNQALQACYDNSKIQSEFLSSSKIYQSIKIKVEWKFRKCPSISFGKNTGEAQEDTYIIEETPVVISIHDIWIKFSKTDNPASSVEAVFNFGILCQIVLLNNNMLTFEPDSCTTEIISGLEAMLSNLLLYEEDYVLASSDYIPISQKDFIKFVINEIVFVSLCSKLKAYIPVLDINKLIGFDVQLYDLQLYAEKQFIVCGANIKKAEKTTEKRISPNPVIPFSFPEDKKFFVIIKFNSILSVLPPLSMYIDEGETFINVRGNIYFHGIEVSSSKNLSYTLRATVQGILSVGILYGEEPIKIIRTIGYVGIGNQSLNKAQITADVDISKKEGIYIHLHKLSNLVLELPPGPLTFLIKPFVNIIVEIMQSRFDVRSKILSSNPFIVDLSKLIPGLKMKTDIQNSVLERKNDNVYHFKFDPHFTVVEGGKEHD